MPNLVEHIIHPNEEQIVLLTKYFGACRFVFNHYLNRINELLSQRKNGVPWDHFNFEADFVRLKKDPEYIWLNEMNCESLDASLLELKIAYNQYYRNGKDLPGFRYKNDSQHYNVMQPIQVMESFVIIPYFKEGIKISCASKIKDEIVSACINKSKSDKYNITFAFAPKPPKVVKKEPRKRVKKVE